MKYIVAVHAHSAVGYCYAHSQLQIQVGVETHVAFDCSAIDSANHAYLYIKTVPSERGGAAGELQIPHSAVLFIAHYDSDDKRPAELGLPSN